MDGKTRIERDLAAAAELLGTARFALAFTGAGISAESGVPTFRGKGGIWDTYDERHLELGFFKAEPALAWATIRGIFYEFERPFEPNDAHRVLAAWEREGLLAFTVTQNIDGLHRKAGSERLAEFHGSTGYLACMRCGARAEATAEALAELPPRCPCGGVYKPDFVFFGEGIPEQAYAESVAAAERADLCLIIGSTGTVYPAASLPRIVKAHGGAVIEINPEASEFSAGVADIVLPLGASAALRDLDGLLRPARAAGGSRP